MQTSSEIEPKLIPLEQLKKSSRWLSGFAADVYSQTGEEGIIAKALSLLPAKDRWCVEFGAWDGRHLSNTYHLVESDQYNVVLIEGDKTKYDALCAEYPFQKQAFFANTFVGWTADDGLDSILSKYAIPQDFDFLSIDIDGNDFHVWKAVEKYRPKLVLIEFNPTSSNRFNYVQPPDPARNTSNSPAPLVALGKSKGYELICVVGPNLLFVDERYFSAFGIPDNSLEVMRDEDEVAKLFLGFDGTLQVEGPTEMRWHGGNFRINQPLWPALRHYPPTYNRFQGLLHRLHRFLKQ